MKAEEKKKLKDKIAEEIILVKKSIVSLEQTSKPVAPDDAIGRLTRMEALSSQGINEANLRASRSRLSMLEQALKRVDNDPEFGICVECEEAIPIGRLMLMPESQRCVHCADT
ncbi:MAG: TraR/DksA C4-type zinc finger protein [Proteobacteria bacterium]|nr:TraR/DksA C4-type zinc finger protein [Pseudomonadota bacterium]